MTQISRTAFCRECNDIDEHGCAFDACMYSADPANCDHECHKEARIDGVDQEEK